MDIDKRNRTELKAYFVKNAIPTEGNFAELIDGVLTQKDDGIVKLPGDPLSIQASGDAAGQKKAINFYESFADPNPAWVLSLNPRSDPSDPATARAGFNISDGAGQSRLFIDRATGDLGVTGSLDVGGDLTVTGTVAGRDVAADGADLDTHLARKDNPHGVTLAQLGAASVAQEAWIAPTFKGSWANYSPSYNNAGYFKDSMGVVHLRGTVKNGSQTIFTLPPGYRPPRREDFVVWTSVGAHCVEVFIDGQVHSKVGDPTGLSLDGITFRAA